jgi:tetratricopeptide (TPR) repeat protein
LAISLFDVTLAASPPKMWRKLATCATFSSFPGTAQSDRWRYIATPHVNGRQQNPSARLPQDEAFLAPENVNVFVGTDARLMIVMAALNLAGYDYEAEGQPSPLRARLRQEMGSLDRSLRGRLTSYFQNHKSPGGNEPAQIAPYVALALAMNPPPSLSVMADPTNVPFDVRSVLDFAQLVKELASSAPMAKLAQEFAKAIGPDVQAYRRFIGQMMFETINYLHTQPILTISSRQIETPPPSEEKKDEKQKQPSQRVVVKERVRRLQVILDPLNATGTFYIRNDFLNAADQTTTRQIGDDYFVIVGITSPRTVPEDKPNVDPVRTAFLRFMLEPLAGRLSKQIREQREQIIKLANQTNSPEATRLHNAVTVVNDSLVAAVETRIKRLRAETTKDSTFDENDAVYYMSEQYRRGAVLVYHFYEKLIPWERVGVDLTAYYEELLSPVDYDRETKRLEQYSQVIARVKERTQLALEREKRLAKMFLDADALIKQRQFEPAQPLLEAIIKEKPSDARALFGLAQVKSQLAAKLDPEKSENPEETQKQLTAQLQQAIELYRQTIKNATEQQRWLVSQAHVAAGKILDFLGEREAAIAEYKAAIALGDIPGGAYAQAQEGIQRPLVK